MEEERGDSSHYWQQKWKIPHHSRWRVKERSSDCAVVGYRWCQNCPDCGQLKSARPKKKKGRNVAQGKEVEQILKTKKDDRSYRNALPVPDRLMKMWQDWRQVWWGETERQKRQKCMIRNI